MTYLTQAIERTARLCRRRMAARRIGVRFSRAAAFTLPKTVRLNGHDCSIHVPEEPGQRVAFIELLLDDCYRLRWIARRARIRTIIDIGANVGLFGLAARAVFPDSTIHAYEPNPDLEPLLAHHAKLAGVAYFLAAVGRNAGSVSLEIDPAGSIFSRSVPDPEGPISQISFGEALTRIGGHAGLVKMDCEGAEWDILADRDSWRRVDFLTMEYHLAEGESHRAIIDCVKSIGFDLCSHQPATNFGLISAQRAGTRK